MLESKVVGAVVKLSIPPHPGTQLGIQSVYDEEESIRLSTSLAIKKLDAKGTLDHNGIDEGVTVRLLLSLRALTMPMGSWKVKR